MGRRRRKLRVGWMVVASRGWETRLVNLLAQKEGDLHLRWVNPTRGACWLTLSPPRQPPASAPRRQSPWSRTRCGPRAACPAPQAPCGVGSLAMPSAQASVTPWPRRQTAQRPAALLDSGAGGGHAPRAPAALALGVSPPCRVSLASERAAGLAYGGGTRPAAKRRVACPHRDVRRARAARTVAEERTILRRSVS